jgi:negative regulator of sigma E activity
MKPLFLITVLAAICACCCACFAQAPSFTPDDAEAQTLLQRMLQAERTLTVSGEQVTTLYRPEQTFSATQSVERQGDHAFRLVYHSPDAVNGEVIVDNGHVFWHSIPSAHKLEVGPSHLNALRQESSWIIRNLESHQLTVHLVGHDIIAGQIAQVIEVTTASSIGERKYWVDPVTGAELKIQTFGPNNQLVSETYYTKIDYNPTLTHSDFGPPPVDPSYAVAPMTPDGSTPISSIPTTDQCGFIITLPAFLPPGFAFQSAMIMPVKGQKLVGLNYANGLVTLSIFEQPILPRHGESPQQNQFKSPRPNVLTARMNGYRYILIGSLPQEVLQQVAESMK